ncbi:hypothetical protein NQ317_006914 [Molorchus minor]|uniref:Uncharacterized protein n=1 Tax=Molorchus minor TaxID=1323400 RepID=A0ABQ9J5U1_9CUCU|nr:hypothetical protein NQ317_006914 [Molorchus minor]
MTIIKKELKMKIITRKKLWQTINEITTNSETVKIASMKNKDNEIINNPTEIAENFNEFFVDIGKNLADKIKRNKSYNEKKTKIEQSIFLFPTNKKRSKNIICQLKNNKAPGNDCISSYESSLPSYNLNFKNDFKILPAKKIKYLGIIIDNHPSDGTHIPQTNEISISKPSRTPPKIWHYRLGWNFKNLPRFLLKKYRNDF